MSYSYSAERASIDAMLDRLRGDTRTAIRSLLATKTPVAAAILTLAVASGVNLAMSGLIDRALLTPPVGLSDPGRIFTLGFAPPGERESSGLMTTTSYPNFAEIRDQVQSLDAAAFQRLPVTVMINGEQRRASSMVVSGEYFTVLGSRAMRGRTLSVADNVPGAASPVAVISDAFWRTALRADPRVVGRRLAVRTIEYEIVGVMPEGYSGHSPLEVDLWVPFAAALPDTTEWVHDQYDRNRITVVARLSPNANVAEAETRAGSVVGRRVVLAGVVGADVAAADRRVAWWLSGVAVLVLVIGLANTATLLVVRAARTRYDIALRATMGASRGRLIQQAIIEAMVVACAATALAWLLSVWMDESVRRVLFPGIVSRSGASAAPVTAALISGLAAFVVAAIVNIWSVPTNAPALMLASHGPGSARRSRLMTILLVMQTAASVLLLAGAAMFGGSLQKLWSQDFGMAMDDVLVVDMELGPTEVDGQDQIYERALRQIRQLPGVVMATPIGAIPFSGFHVPPIAVPGRDTPAVGRQLPYLTQVTPQFLKILGIQLLEGRMLTDADERGSLVVMVNQSMARGVWPGESALGKCIRIGFDPDFDPATATGPPTPTERVPCREVVGVVRDVRQRSVLPAGNEDRLMQYFVPFSQIPVSPFAPNPTRIRGLMLRVSSHPGRLAPIVRRAVVGDRTDLPFVRVRPYAELLERQMRPWSMGTRLLLLFSTLAVSVAAIGLYAAFAHAVAERRREMAIRLAVGAESSAILRMVLSDALVLTATGSVIGCAAAAASGRWVQSLLFGTQPWDPSVLGGAATAMLIVALLATFKPAREASKTDPSQLLRSS